MSNESKSPIAPVKAAPPATPSQQQILQQKYMQACTQLGDIAYKLAASRNQTNALQATHDSLVKQCHDLNVEAAKKPEAPVENKNGTEK